MERITTLRQLDEARGKGQFAYAYINKHDPLVKVRPCVLMDMEADEVLGMLQDGLYIDQPQPRCAECGQWMEKGREGEYCGRCEVYKNITENPITYKPCWNCDVSVPVVVSEANGPVYCPSCNNSGKLWRKLRRLFARDSEIEELIK